jgi:hypothetical protein
MTCSSFNRNTLKLLVAAVFLLGGLQYMDLHAQTYCGGMCGAGAISDGAPDDSTTPASAIDSDGWLDWLRGLGATSGPSVQFSLAGENEYARGPHNVQPTTLPTVRYSWTHRQAQVSGVVFAEGQPLPRAKVDVVVVLDGGFSRAETVSTDGNGAYAATIPAPSRIASVSVSARNVCSTGDDKDCYANDSILIAAGAAISNSSPASETTSHVDEAVDATTLF